MSNKEVILYKKERIPDHFFSDCQQCQCFYMSPTAHPWDDWLDFPVASRSYQHGNIHIQWTSRERCGILKLNCACCVIEGVMIQWLSFSQEHCWGANKWEPEAAVHGCCMSFFTQMLSYIPVALGCLSHSRLKVCKQEMCLLLGKPFL